ncbi:hypothetical protein EXS87_06060 [Helicobacter pylori]|nr:hypothetical protein [Helicobacter pylori]NHB56051.1 hypothetical protein [Helicobacter pylori]
MKQVIKRVLKGLLPNRVLNAYHHVENLGAIKEQVRSNTEALRSFKEQINSIANQVNSILTRMLVFVSKSHRKGLKNYGKNFKT